jgi:hypothetical protein
MGNTSMSSSGEDGEIGYFLATDNDDTGTGHHTAHRSAINPRGLLDIAGHLFRDKIGVICKYRG